MSRRWLQSADVEINDDTGAIWVQPSNLPQNPSSGAILVDVSGLQFVQGNNALLIQGEVVNIPKPPTALSGGVKTTSNNNTEPLVDNSMPCQFVWIGARVDDLGVAQNSALCFVGNTSSPTIPILPNDFKGIMIPIDDASKISVRTVSMGEGVAFQIFA
jgi:hypothetical protein